jgi:Zn-dependent M28 family amino/carboxypeptidase
VVTRNVAGELPGRLRPEERIIYTAHWDHLGVGLPDSRGDRIYNGAVDNADGVGVLVEIARAFAQTPRTERTVTFLALAAEEKGLLGSEYYAAHPLHPLATTVAVVNMDALSTAGPARDFTTSGDAPVTLQDELVAAGRAEGRRYSPDPRAEAGSFFRSDHFSFAKRGVPAVSFGSGRDLVSGGTAAGDAWAKAYTAERYHQPSDEIGPDWYADGLALDATLLYELGRKLADSRIWPEWKAGAEFKAVRDQTATQRN